MEAIPQERRPPLPFAVMSRLSLSEVIRAPLQEGEETVYDSSTRAVIVAGEVFYYRRAEHYRDWIEVFTHKGESLGGFRTLGHFTRAFANAADRSRLPATDAGRALYRELAPLVGHRIVGIEILEAADCLMPYSVLLIDDGREVVIQSDPEGNDGGFPKVSKATPGPAHDPEP